jgi:hypothetical protein
MAGTITSPGMMNRYFLATDAPMLPAIAQMLIDTAPTEGFIDLRTHCVLLPTARACRKLSLLLGVDSQGRAIFPPRIVTSTGLVQQCLPPRRTQASELMVAITWQHVLAHAPEEDCRAIVGHDQAIEARERASIALRLQTIVRELATAGMAPAEVAAKIASDHLPMSTQLWVAIDRLRRAMRSVLDEAGLDEPETARAELLATGNVFVDGWTHLWVVAADPAPRERALLDAIETHGVSVTSLVHGDEAKLGEAFSETGVIDREWWTRAKVAFDTNTIHTCDSVPDQVAVVLSCLANAGEVDPTKVSIVVPDASLGPLLHRGTRAEGVHVHLADGQSSATGRIGSLLTALHACLVSDDAAVWGDLLRY